MINKETLSKIQVANVYASGDVLHVDVDGIIPVVIQDVQIEILPPKEGNN